MKHRLLVLLFLCSLPIAASPQQTKRTPSMSSGESSESTARPLDFGDEVWVKGSITLEAPYRRVTLLFIDEASFQEYLDHSTTDERWKKWLAEGKFFLALDRTKAVVQQSAELDIAGHKTQAVNVRIAEGKLKGKRGWTFASNVALIN